MLDHNWRLVIIDCTFCMTNVTILQHVGGINTQNMMTI